MFILPRGKFKTPIPAASAMVGGRVGSDLILAQTFLNFCAYVLLWGNAI